MKNIKFAQKGITLVAIIITIIVMLILVGVTLAITLDEDGIIYKTKEVTELQEKETDKEALQERILGLLSNESHINLEELNGQEANGYLLEYTSSRDYAIATKGEIKFYIDKAGKIIDKPLVPSTYTIGTTILGENVILKPYENLEGKIKEVVDIGKITAVLQETKDNKILEAVIPTGLTISSTTGENTISGGLVVRDNDENEFVWIPVTDIDSMAVLKDNSLENYRGVLYNWSKQIDGTQAKDWKETESREPSNIANYDSQSQFTRYGGGTWTEDMYQTEFNKMVKSVKSYGGFFSGRYETSNLNLANNSTKVKVVSGANLPGMCEIIWYVMYKNSKTLSSDSVTSCMIWGCQFDQILKWTGYANANASTFSQDKTHNIYSLAGNKSEWSQEATGTDARVTRGGNSRYGGKAYGLSVRKRSI